MVLDQLPGPSDGVLEGLAVTWVDDGRCQLDQAMESGEVVAERIGAALRVEPHSRRDPLEQRVPADEHALAEEADVTVGMPRKLDDPPAAHVASLVEELGMADEADERPKSVPLLD